MKRYEKNHAFHALLFGFNNQNQKLVLVLKDHFEPLHLSVDFALLIK